MCEVLSFGFNKERATVDLTCIGNLNNAEVQSVLVHNYKNIRIFIVKFVPDDYLKYHDRILTYQLNYLEQQCNYFDILKALKHNVPMW